MATPIELVHEIEKLPPIERVKIVDIVMRDVMHPDSEIEKVWAQEASARWDAYKSGEIKSVSYEEVMSKYKRLRSYPKRRLIYEGKSGHGRGLLYGVQGA